MAEPAQIERTRIEGKVRELGPWFHDLDLRGVRTAPDHPLGDFLEDLWRTVRSAFPEDMRGMTALDIGCNAGFYSQRLAERGARVTGIDHDARYLAQARYAAEVLGYDIDFVQLEAYAVPELGRTFDYVLFMGVFYHLRYPLLALDRVVPTVGRRLVFQSMVRGPSWRGGPIAEDYPFTEEALFEKPGYPAMYFVERRYAGDPTNWWIPNEAGLQAMLRAAGLDIEEHPGAGVYFCRPAAANGE